ncbi:hypothetical protein [Companilactobacillus musae]|uniref:lectin-like domain-containing protein n=1 Tax=Companilactobacillus musae TaxID=1903258 RepID=UPI000E6584D8|nr:hypothetical protein [Companilactobacillus musae]
MNNFHQKDFLIFGIFLCTLILFLGTFSTTVFGDSDYDHALSTTPKGLDWDDGNFVIAKFPPKPDNAPLSSPTGKKYSYNNNATIVHSTNPATKNTSVISLTNGTYQVGAVWSKFEKDNYFDLSHEQVASMWIYFGNTGGEAPGDGMAFVLQNDKRGENSIALSSTGIPVNGQSLGVWGADWDKTNSEPSNISKTAIQNSWAMEFDTYKNLLTGANEISGEGVSFDATNPGTYSQHIATGFPASSKTYIRQKASNTNPPIYYYTMHHDNFIGIKNLVDSKWHHVTIKWSPNTSANSQQIPTGGTMTYSYNDKNIDGTPNTDGVQSTSFDLDTSNFNLKSDSKLYWGFTGSTGKYYENNLMVFESIPSFVDAEAIPRIHDNTQNRDIAANDTNVDPNDDISYFYTLNYKGWTKTWNKINATINVPNNIHFTTGSIKYESTGKTYNISDLLVNDPRIVQTQLPDPLSHESPKAVIELRGHTETIATTQLKVPAAYASFDGDNLITDTNTNQFFIKSRLLTLKSDFPEVKNVQPNEDVDIPGELEYHDGTSLISSNMTVYPTLNNKSLSPFRLNDDNPATGFKLHLTGDQLSHSKINMITFYVKDNLGNTTNKITRQINIDDSGTLQFGNITKKMQFKNTNLTFPNQIIPRFDTWEVNILDSRKKGNNWQVQAQSADLINNTDKTKFNGNMIFKDQSGKITLLNKGASIAQHYKDTDGIESKNITEEWKSQNGILLLSEAHNKAGTYSGLINWTLQDSVPNK